LKGTEMTIKPCKVCGSLPVFVQMRDYMREDFYICLNKLRGECPSTEDIAEEKAKKIWNERN